MNDQQLITTLRQHLDEGLADLPDRVQDRLTMARQKALQQRHESRRQGWLLGHGLLRPALATAILVAALGLTDSYLQGQNEISDMAAVDSDLLIDDLPPKAFSDPGFRAWLEESSEG